MPYITLSPATRPDVNHNTTNFFCVEPNLHRARSLCCTWASTAKRGGAKKKCMKRFRGRGLASNRTKMQAAPRCFFGGPGKARMGAGGMGNERERERDSMSHKGYEVIFAREKNQIKSHPGRTRFCALTNFSLILRAGIPHQSHPDSIMFPKTPPHLALTEKGSTSSKFIIVPFDPPTLACSPGPLDLLLPPRF